MRRRGWESSVRRFQVVPTCVFCEDDALKRVSLAMCESVSHKPCTGAAGDGRRHLPRWLEWLQQDADGGAFRRRRAAEGGLVGLDAHAGQLGNEKARSHAHEKMACIAVLDDSSFRSLPGLRRDGQGGKRPSFHRLGNRCFASQGSTGSIRTVHFLGALL